MDTPAKRLKHARKVKGLNQIDLARLADVATGTIGNIESGKRGIKSSALALARALDVSPDWLATGEGPMQPKVMADLASGNVSEIKKRAIVPLISWVQAGEFSEVLDIFHPGEAVQWEEAYHSNPSQRSYAPCPQPHQTRFGGFFVAWAPGSGKP